MDAAGPLADILVIDLTRALAGPHCAMMLGDLGARVVKIEAPGGGDDTRAWGPPFIGPGEGTSTYFLAANRNKESVVLDLKDAADLAVLEDLLRGADVLLENFRPGVLDRLGLSAEHLRELNPRLVTASISGFGHDGPDGGRAGYDQIAQGEAGIMSVTGPDAEHATKVGVPIGDVAAGMYAAFGVLAALHERERTGRGALVRTSLLAALVGMHGFQGTVWTVAHQVPHAQGPHHPSICPYGMFSASDGVVQVAVGSEPLWRTFAEAFELPVDRVGFATNAERVRNADEVGAAVAEAFGAYTADDLLAKLDGLGVPAGKVRSLSEVYEWEQTRSQGLVVQVEHAVLGPIELPGPPLRIFDGGGAEWRRKHSAPPLYGADTEAVRREFGAA